MRETGLAEPLAFKGGESPVPQGILPLAQASLPSLMGDATTALLLQPKPQHAITIAVSSRALFRMEEEQKIYTEQGVEAYVKYQLEHEEEPFLPGAAFPFVKVWSLLLTFTHVNTANVGPQRGVGEVSTRGHFPGGKVGAFHPLALPPITLESSIPILAGDDC